MTRERYNEYVERLQELQMDCAAEYGIIFALSVSHTQVRVVVYAQLSPAQSFFLYKDADPREGEKMMQRITNFVKSISTWNELNLDKSNG